MGTFRNELIAQRWPFFLVIVFFVRLLLKKKQFKPVPVMLSLLYKIKKFMVLFFLCFFALSCDLLSNSPTKTDVRYSKEFERSKLDLWLADSKIFTPLVVNFHGGGFRQGDKRSFQKSLIVKKYLPEGISFASVNYPFVQQVDGNYSKILEHCAESILFLKKNAKKFNIDHNRISVMGNSAGALITCYLGHAKKLGIRSIFPIQQPKGTPLLIPFFRKDGPAVMVYNRSGKNDKIHHPDFAIMVRERCKELGIKCHAYGVRGTGLDQLPEDKNLYDLAMDFFRKSWNEDKRKNK